MILAGENGSFSFCIFHGDASLEFNLKSDSLVLKESSSEISIAGGNSNYSKTVYVYDACRYSRFRFLLNL